MTDEKPAVHEALAVYAPETDETERVPPGYKWTEVGVIPEDWGVSQLGSSGEVVMGQSPPGSSYNRKGYGSPLINGPTEFTSKYPLRTQWTTQPARFCKPGDLLICVRGSSTGRTNYADDVYAIGRGIAAIRSKDNNDTGYLSYQVISGVSDILTEATGSTFPSVDGVSLRKIVFPLPSEPTEQRAIAAALSDVDDLISALDKLIAKKRAVKTAAMQQLLTGKQRLPGFSGEWEVKRLEEVADVDSDNLDADTDPDYEFNYVSLEGVDRGILRDFSHQRFSSAPSRARRRLRAGDVLVSTVRPNLKSHLLFSVSEGNWVCSTGFSLVRCRKRTANPGFVYQHLFHGVIPKQIEALITGSNYPAISANDVRAFQIPMPSVEEQTAIAAVLSDMDAEIEALEGRREKTRRIKAGMMQELLTGRTRLVYDVAKEEQKRSVEQIESKRPGHNWAFNEAVVISALANKFGTSKYPLGRMRYTKLSYLMHRHIEGDPEGYIKKAAGPYNPGTRYKGPEGIAQKNLYVESTQSGKFSGFVADRNIDQALDYFEKWYGENALEWLEQFRYEKNDWLEVLTTVDMAVQELREEKREITVANVEGVLQDNEEWRPKLERKIFSKTNIERAISTSRELFGEG